ncbi:unnamed protein product [Effrenium voratum]|nr:unnamed protein product [Effrenium voratum]
MWRPRAMELMTKMQRGMISPEEQLELSKAMCESNDFWLANQLRLRYAEDFQGIEAFKITEE